MATEKVANRKVQARPTHGEVYELRASSHNMSGGGLHWRRAAGSSSSVRSATFL
jgi:hypothetical protein